MIQLKNILEEKEKVACSLELRFKLYSESYQDS